MIVRSHVSKNLSEMGGAFSSGVPDVLRQMQKTTHNGGS